MTATFRSTRMLPPSRVRCTSGAAARGKRVIARLHEQRVELGPPDAHIAAVEDGQRERVLQQRPERCLMIIAVDADDPHELADDADRGFGTIDLRLDGKLSGRRRLRIERVAGPPAQAAHSFYRGLGIGEGVSDRLMLDNRVNAAALLGTRKMKREVECSAHQRDTKNADKCSGSRERSRRQRETAALLAKKI